MEDNNDFISGFWNPEVNRLRNLGPTCKIRSINVPLQLTRLDLVLSFYEITLHHRIRISDNGIRRRVPAASQPVLASCLYMPWA